MTVTSLAASSLISATFLYSGSFSNASFAPGLANQLTYGEQYSNRSRVTATNVLGSKTKIRFQDCDPFNHLNNAAYINYLINAREDD